MLPDLKKFKTAKLKQTTVQKLKTLILENNFLFFSKYNIIIKATTMNHEEGVKVTSNDSVTRLYKKLLSIDFS